MLERRNYATRPFATPMQKDHVRLKDSWDRVNRELKAQGKPKLLQKSLAADWKVTETLIGHYLHGREPLNDKWKLRFAKFLGLKVTEIWSDFEFKEVMTSNVPIAALEFTLDFLELTEDAQLQLQRMAKMLPRRPKSKTGTH